MTTRAARQKGAALLTALLSVALIASLAGTALWHQWRVIEVERSERARLQAEWILSGALDWGRLILREDARQGGADHLGEPWAVPLQEARLSTFLATDKTAPPDAQLSDSFLAGRLEDLQGRLNVRNLVDGGSVSLADLSAFQRLFEQLGLPSTELQQLGRNLREALATPAPGRDMAAPFAPQRVDHLVWLGLSPQSLNKLRPFITLLPERTGLNLNTAAAEVLSASAPALAPQQARHLVDSRRNKPWRSVDEANQAAGGLLFREGTHAIQSRYFLISGQLRQGSNSLEAQALVRRDGLETRILWRDLHPMALDESKATAPSSPR